MKKIITLLLAVSITLSLAACGKSEAAANVDNMITAIGEITLDSESKIIEAEDAVSALEAKDQGQLDSTQVLADARSAYEALVIANEIAQVQDAISAIGAVTQDSGNAISAARSLYDSSPADIQSGVENYSVLEASENALGDLRVADVTALIAAIGTVTLESGESIDAAQSAFDALSGDDAANVTNQAVLSDAVAAFDVLSAEAKEKALADALASLDIETDRVQGITWYESNQQPYYADTRSYVLPYIGQSSTNTWLRLRFHYTEDDWIFFSSVTIVVDEEKYYKYFTNAELERDHDNGLVWEWADIVPSDSDIELLRAIAASTETIVRFNGDIYHYDLTVKDSDKGGITSVLDAYEAMT